jgi:hypothetical protein
MLPKLRDAVNPGKLKIAKYLIDKGANFEIDSFDEDGFKIYSQFDDTLLHRATHNSFDLDIIDYLIKKGANVNAKDHLGKTPLHRAVRSRRLDVVKYLITQGADVNAKEEFGDGVLVSAVSSGNLEMVKYIVEQGADINNTDRRGWTVFAFAERYPEIHKYLTEIRNEQLKAKELAKAETKAAAEAAAKKKTKRSCLLRRLFMQDEGE